MNVPRDGTAALPNLTALTHRAHTDATVCQVGENEAIIRVST